MDFFLFQFVEILFVTVLLGFAYRRRSQTPHLNRLYFTHYLKLAHFKISLFLNALLLKTGRILDFLNLLEGFVLFTKGL